MLSFLTNLLFALTSLLSCLPLLFNPSFKMTRNVAYTHTRAHTHCTIALALLLPGNIVFCYPNRKRESMIYRRKMEKDDEWGYGAIDNTYTVCFAVSLLCCCPRAVCIKDSISSPMQGWNLLAATVCVRRQVTVVSTTLTMGSSQKISAPSCCVGPLPVFRSTKVTNNLPSQNKPARPKGTHDDFKSALFFSLSSNPMKGYVQQ